ncbi:MAG TPA: glutamine amidotransferase [Treponema sp.]|nr:glutamine amidotransferase [Treponema sp.]
MTVFLYVTDTLADWEIAFLTAELYSKRFFADKRTDCKIVKTGMTDEPVTTMGGMKIIPDCTVDDIVLKDGDMLVLPGADTWLSPVHDRILEIADKRIQAELPVAAICGATAGLARTGALNRRKHTSNDVSFLKQAVPSYTGEPLYVQDSAVSDRNLVTASGQAPLLFAYEILKLLHVFRPDTLEAWKNLYLTNEPVYFYRLMQSLSVQQ